MSEERKIWTAKVLTLFPEMFPGPLAHSLAGKALGRDKWSLEPIDIREYALGKHRKVDDAPFGGGAGMVMRADVVDAAIKDVAVADAPLIYLTPRGKRFDQAYARELAAGPGAILICGRYEGIDQRVLDARSVTEISLGDFVLSGGEPAALAIIDASVRLLPDIMGAEASLEDESFDRGLLEYPHYTRPAEWCGRKVPEVLLSGHHENICAWRTEQAEIATRERRPDLWKRYRQNLQNQKENYYERD
ncbi:MAG: tRNA (guanine-N(1)-)-methyltransferase [Alphaproteobacteria bacterium MarineAlpha11_Bin1]|nr:MAG: tRNA (guanine-N(1)-)-methyltransferase [Alphaproteobacteria bacterium MarineAlpha11_Bin1]